MNLSQRSQKKHVLETLERDMPFETKVRRNRHAEQSNKITRLDHIDIKMETAYKRSYFFAYITDPEKLGLSTLSDWHTYNVRFQSSSLRPMRYYTHCSSSV